MTPDQARTEAPEAVSCPRSPRAGEWALDGYTRRDVVVVGDRFARFARGDRVLTLSDLLALLESGGLPAPGCHWVVHFGQGVDTADGERLEAACGRSDGAVRLADPETFRRRPESPAVVHKSRPENVLLAGVHSPEPARCRAELRIHRDNELVLDHHTGEHVQGIVIIEAMRQICIAQFETAIRPGLAPAAAYAGVWQRIDLSFEDFLFPLPATVESVIVDSDLGRETHLKFRATTAVRQHGRAVATAGIEYSMIAQERIDTLERRKADQATRAYLG
ncbi:AfsA-related hotdog domain-containing protein [Amycolatopsis tolypomycina]|uniref:A-factor biosynthesis hotdog domain-containing protein n=1 Tax=Amycolatopsis tolypomycina TaxID=208445 RepID=A0A1H4UNZ0_9PSEU|nr:AfsA-related hotdog domain-containing protein [Amycolatopsis tolypomycina]SEC70435.1 A-factor biosynthesis hotdog domain-containing protein [Amycolatopsis tolypomycina]